VELASELTLDRHPGDLTRHSSRNEGKEKREPQIRSIGGHSVKVVVPIPGWLRLH
jgi:hypothetical protein